MELVLPPGVARGHIIAADSDEADAEVTTYPAVVLVDLDGTMHVDVDWSAGVPGRVADE